jgi:hypothetical protein
MKTTVDIPDKSLRDLMNFTRAGTKRAAIVRAVDEFNQRQRMTRLTKYVGAFNDFMTQEDLARDRDES